MFLADKKFAQNFCSTFRFTIIMVLIYESKMEIEFNSISFHCVVFRTINFIGSPQWPEMKTVWRLFLDHCKVFTQPSPLAIIFKLQLTKGEECCKLLFSSLKIWLIHLDWKDENFPIWRKKMKSVKKVLKKWQKIEQLQEWILNWLILLLKYKIGIKKKFTAPQITSAPDAYHSTFFSNGNYRLFEGNPLLTSLTEGNFEIWDQTFFFFFFEN